MKKLILDLIKERKENGFGSSNDFYIEDYYYDIFLVAEKNNMEIDLPTFKDAYDFYKSNF